jgi:SRSO17 transposase
MHVEVKFIARNLIAIGFKQYWLVSDVDYGEVSEGRICHYII